MKTSEGTLNQDGNDTQQAHPSAGSIQQSTRRENRPSSAESSFRESSSSSDGTLKTPPVKIPQQQPAQQILQEATKKLLSTASIARRELRKQLQETLDEILSLDKINLTRMEEMAKRLKMDISEVKRCVKESEEIVNNFIEELEQVQNPFDI